MTGITKRQIFTYTVLPQIRPRIVELIATGFNYIPFFIALVFHAVRIFPAAHPYVNPANIGKYGIRHVIAEAASHVVFSWRNIDQILVFFFILLGLMIAVTQVFLLGFSLIFGPVMAMPTTFAEFFVTKNPRQDIAHMLLDMVFGIKGFFNSCVDPTSKIVGLMVQQDCIDTDGVGIYDQNNAWILSSLNWPYPIHEALHQLFLVYSLGLLIVATMITSYFIVTILMETAESGTPFGKRFNKVWAPIRLVVAFGLLIPITNGLNSSQYVVLYAAKFGSAFATNGWLLFNKTLEDNYTLTNETQLGDSASFVGEPNAPEIGGLLQFLFTSAVCSEIYLKKNPNNYIDIYAVKGTGSTTSSVRIYNSQTKTFTSPDPYQQIIDFIKADKSQQAILRFGVRNKKIYNDEMGYVSPICGELILQLSDPRDPNGTIKPERGPEIMQRYYTYIITELWADVYRGNPPPGSPISSYTQNYAENVAEKYLQDDPDPLAILPPASYRKDLQEFYTRDIVAAMTNPTSTGLDGIKGIGTEGAIPEQGSLAEWAVGAGLQNRGWAAAGIWYNKIAEFNGSIISSVASVPIPSDFPNVMEMVLESKKQHDQLVVVSNRYEPDFSGNTDAWIGKPSDLKEANVLWIAFNYWQKGDFAASSQTEPTGVVMKDLLNVILGTSGLYSMRKNDNIHPLAQLVGVGKSLVEATILNVGLASAGGVVGALGGIFAQGGDMVIEITMMIAMATITIGFILYYIVPFLPFIYFFFAVGGWVKGIFEAMVGAPLWALAHIRIDADGLPGKAAVNGYFLIFEIFLRPILIIFGLLASISIFSALVISLNEVWDIVVLNVSGYDMKTEVGATAGQSKIEFIRDSVDEFFFTVVYTVIVYLMGMSSFKLIDLIPNSIMRWMGQSVKTFNDSQEDAAQGLVGTATLGGQQTFRAFGEGYKGGLQNLTPGGM